MNDNNYIVVQGWMCNRLKLSGNELLVFALVYGFSQDGESDFSGSRAYISNTLNISKPTVDKALNSLINKGLIEKRHVFVNEVQLNRYKVILQGVKNLYGGGKETLLGSKETLLGGSKETLHNKYNYNNTNNKNKDNIGNNPPTVDQVKQYCEERHNNIDAEQFIDFYESKGWMIGKNKMKDWKACVRTWERSQKSKKSKEEIKSVNSSENLSALESFWENSL